MGTRLYSVVIDCGDHVAQARWWAQTLRWTVVHVDDHEAAVEPSSASPHDLALVFVPVPEPKHGKNRIHLDLGSPTAQAHRDLVDQAQARGASAVDIGQKEVSWTVLADPEGNEFCVLAPDRRVEEPGALAAIVVDARRPAPLARFWAEAGGWRISCESHLVARLRHPERRRPTMDLVAVADPTSGKNRVHLDVAPDIDGEQRAEVERLVRLGARPVDIGQGDASWVVLADPEDNEFCVLSPR
ncbi:MAG: VOC family protein [Actinobacteria bacterium]|nr:VOC family protein [Actinomycetota bacterium]